MIFPCTTKTFKKILARRTRETKATMLCMWLSKMKKEHMERESVRKLVDWESLAGFFVRSVLLRYMVKYPLVLEMLSDDILQAVHNKDEMSWDMTIGKSSRSANVRGLLFAVKFDGDYVELSLDAKKMLLDYVELRHSGGAVFSGDIVGESVTFSISIDSSTKAKLPWITGRGRITYRLNFSVN